MRERGYVYYVYKSIIIKFFPVIYISHELEFDTLLSFDNSLGLGSFLAGCCSILPNATGYT